MYQELVKRVFYLRLFYNTKDEFGAKDEFGIKLNLKGKNKALNLSSGEAYIVFNHLKQTAQDKIDIDLEKVLDLYEQASKDYDMSIKDCYKNRGEEQQEKFQEKVLEFILKKNCINDYENKIMDDRDYKDLKLKDRKKIKDILEKTGNERIYVSILLLLIMDIIPSYKTVGGKKAGDVKNLSCDYEKLIKFLTDFFRKNNAIFSNFPSHFLIQNSINSRIELIGQVNRILNLFPDIFNRENLPSFLDNIKENIILPDIDDTIWRDEKECSDCKKKCKAFYKNESANECYDECPAEYWKFLYDGDFGFNLMKIKNNRKEKQTDLEIYIVVFFNNDTISLTPVTPSSLISFFCDDKKNPFDQLSFYDINISQKQNIPVRIGFSKIHPKGPLLPENLIKVPEKTCSVLKQYDEGNINDALKNLRLSESDVQSSVPLVITSEYIFVKKNTIYYRIPKELNKGLSNITTRNSVAIITLKGRTKIWFVELSLLYDITDRESREKSGIEVVDENDSAKLSELICVQH